MSDMHVTYELLDLLLHKMRVWLAGPHRRRAHLARLSGISPSTVSRLMGGRFTKPEVDTIIRLLQVVSPDDTRWMALISGTDIAPVTIEAQHDTRHLIYPLIYSDRNVEHPDLLIGIFDSVYSEMTGEPRFSLDTPRPPAS